MMLDLFSDGEPEAVWTTDLNGNGEANMVVTLGDLELSVAQPGASTVGSVGTGALVWQAGPALASCLMSSGGGSLSDQIVNGRSIEFGCGCSALPGVALALLGAKEVVVSDSAAVLSELQPNLESYFAAWQSDSNRRCSDLREQLSARPIGWDEAVSLAQLASHPQGCSLVVAADCDYADTLHGMLLDAVSAALDPSPGKGVALFATAARCQRTLGIFLSRLRERRFEVAELGDDLQPLAPADAAVRSRSYDGVRYFAARWKSREDGEAARARFAAAAGTAADAARASAPVEPPPVGLETPPVGLETPPVGLETPAPPVPSGGSQRTITGGDDAGVGAALDAVDAALAALDAADDLTALPMPALAPPAAIASAAPPPATAGPPVVAATAGQHWSPVSPAATARFLTKCARKPDRFFYPCNAKHRETPARCIYRFRRQCTPTTTAATEIAVYLAECAYSAGGTGWRVWPCALLLSCWLVARAPSLRLSQRRTSALELGCGLGLPGLTAAALGARRAVLSDCLPELLVAIGESVRANLAAAGDGTAPPAEGGSSPAPPAEGGSSPAMASLAVADASADGVHVACLDWDQEAPVEDAALAAEEFSTEQGVKAAQLAQPSSAVALDASERFGLVLASDVIYSLTHATQLPEVIARRLKPPQKGVDAGAGAGAGGAPATIPGESGGGSGRLAAMVPVRSEAHTCKFLDGLVAHGMAVSIARVDAAWVEAVVAPQLASAPSVTSVPEGVPFRQGETALVEGEIVFVEAWFGS
jgi:predicted nicotinamide N-methyase